jgi:hypothetical protein
MDRGRFDDGDGAQRESGRKLATPARTSRRAGRGLPMALPSALAGIMLSGAIALGATSVGTIGLVSTTSTCQDEQGNVIACPGDPPGGQGGSDPTATPTPTPTPPPNDGPGSGSTDKPKPDPKPASMHLSLSNVGRGVKVDWARCGSHRFDLYAIVRSTDATVSWPLGAHDRLVGVIWHRGRTVWIDRRAPAGTTVWYRVFCLDRTHHHGLRVVKSSPVESIETLGKTTGG